MTESEGRSAVRQEAQDVSGKTAVLAGGIVIAIGTAAVAVMALVLQARREAHGRNTTDSARAPMTSSARIESSLIRRVGAGLDHQREAIERLQSWGWVERDKVARIPIDEAAEWLLRDAQSGPLSWGDRVAPNAVVWEGRGAPLEPGGEANRGRPRATQMATTTPLSGSEDDDR